MVIRPEAADEARAVFEKWGVDFAVIGRVTETGRFVLKAGGAVVGDLPVRPLVDEAPVYERPYELTPRPASLARAPEEEASAPEPMEALQTLLAAPDLCSKRWIWEQYDHMVMADTVQPPGGDAAVVRVHGTGKGLALTADCTPRYCAADPASGGAQAVAEAWRNLTAVGARPLAITDCLNFGNPERPQVMGQFAGCIEGMAAAWSPATDGPVEAEVVILPHADSPGAFQASLSEVRGKFVLVSRPEPSCRAPDNLEQFARPETTARMTAERERAIAEWSDRVGNTGFDQRSLPEVLSVAEPAAVIRSQWSEGWGVTKIFGTRAQRAPVLDLSCEAYGLLYRLAENDQGPVLRVDVQARFLGEVPVFNAFAVIPGSAEPEEYVILGGHYDSWDGADGALDNGTGAVAIMEAMRILKSAVPNPRPRRLGRIP